MFPVDSEQENEIGVDDCGICVGVSVGIGEGVITGVSLVGKYVGVYVETREGVAKIAGSLKSLDVQAANPKHTRQL